LEVASPNLVWENKNMVNHFNTCVLIDGHLYGINCDTKREQEGNLRCIELKTGKLKWQTQPDESDVEHDPLAAGQLALKSYGRGSAALAEGNFIVQAETGLLALVELNPTEFREISRIKYPELGYPSWTAPVLSRQRLYLSGARQVTTPDGRRVYEYNLLCVDLARAG
jgi:outer membrane protein assembly factor BamB